jgi:hypothetical protein
MYFRLNLEDGTEVYKDFDNNDLMKIIDEEIIFDIICLIGERIGENIEDWNFTDKPIGRHEYLDVVQIDVSSAIIKENPDLVIDGKKVLKINLLEESTYEHALATLSLTDSKAVVYSKNIEYTTDYDYDYDNDDDGGYSDEPDYD